MPYQRIGGVARSRPRPYDKDPSRAYPDDGCSVAPRCLACPLPVCRYDGAAGLLALAQWKLEQPERRNA